LKRKEAAEGRELDYVESIYPFIKTVMDEVIDDREGLSSFLLSERLDGFLDAILLELTLPY